MTLTEAAALVGLITGTSGLVLGLLNYLRDSVKVTVSLKWDMSIIGGQVDDPKRKWGLVTICNVGRRPVYLSHAALRLPRGHDASHAVLAESIHGKRLAEGDPPLTYPIDQSDLGQYSKDWKTIRVQVTDSTGKEWVSPLNRKMQKPSWGQ